MAREATPMTQVEGQQTPQPHSVLPVKQKRKRSPSVAKPAYFIIQVLDENGQPMPFDKKRMKLLKVERSADSVLEVVESGEHPHAFYLRGIVPVARQSQPRAQPGNSPPAAA